MDEWPRNDGVVRTGTICTAFCHRCAAWFVPRPADADEPAHVWVVEDPEAALRDHLRDCHAQTDPVIAREAMTVIDWPTP